MDARQITELGVQLISFLEEVDDCFGRSEPREHLLTYVSGQLSDLPRKSIEPIALGNGTPPRTLQRFLESARWDERRLRDRLQGIVVRDHAHPQAIGTIDESGHPKKGRHTAAVKRQWCGNTGKIDNCVVSVHLGYVAGDFQCLLDSDLYLPKDWANDPVRRAQAYIPDDVVYRKKTDIALAQVQRALANGIRVAAWTFEEWYGRDGSFLDGLEVLGQNYVAEVPSTFTGWLREPAVLLRPTPQEMRKGGERGRFPRLARQALPASEVRNLVTCSPVFSKQKWQRFHIKDGEKGPMVWEVKHARFFRKRPHGLPGPAGCLIIARDVLNPDDMKFFVANMWPGWSDVSLTWLLWVAFSRWPIERCFQQAKDELGMDHFEIRGWRSIHRHLYITQLTHLFCARVHQSLREKNDGLPVPHRRAGSRRGLRLGRRSGVAALSPHQDLPGNGRTDRLLPTSPSAGPQISYQKDTHAPPRNWRQSRSITLLCTG
ncbi:MAG: IS701 family transposase [Gemmatimonadales bacterium]